MALLMTCRVLSMYRHRSQLLAIAKSEELCSKLSTYFISVAISDFNFNLHSIGQSSESEQQNTQCGCTETSWRVQNVEIVQFVTRLLSVKFMFWQSLVTYTAKKYSFHPK